MKRPEAAEAEEEKELEILKAAAQAWHAHSGNPKPSDDYFGARKSSSRGRRPSRFKLEAVAAEGTWDFARSMWDSYEIVTLSKKLEANLALDEPLPAAPRKRTRESKNSLRNLFHRTSSSRRFDTEVVPKEEI